ncbi:hypothetical protein NEF87_004177 [Candidatus Lokiarchaeum ossiferum]|uniref:DUF1667 domain-containing protein n=1 Tax=Candidatus Lokiarchaeum ossiferum TaxID=2951803 RepID=A0ABY6HYE8_9ARCH|nr:hypothetical protein NEF87_004177 [Candidatus Lokiarchaeum sp. B-35]
MEERINEREIICVICPNSCRLTVWRDKEGELHIKGNQCPRGLTYGESEYTNPVRMLITTMRIEGATLPVIPVRSVEPIPKQHLLRSIKVVNDVVCQAPIKMGDVLIKNILGTGIDVIASRSMDTFEGTSKRIHRYNKNDLNETIFHTLVDTFYGGNTQISAEDRLKIEEAEKIIINRLKKFGLQTE